MPRPERRRPKTSDVSCDDGARGHHLPFEGAVETANRSSDSTAASKETDLPSMSQQSPGKHSLWRMKLEGVKESYNFPSLLQDQSRPCAKDIPDTVVRELGIRPKMLCLHGKASNSHVTKMQITNLGFDELFDTVFLDAPYEVTCEDPEGLLGIQGPYFSWAGSEVDSRNLQTTVSFVMEAMSDVDAVMGFSQGAAVALAACDLIWRAKGKLIPCFCVCPAGLACLQALNVSASSPIHAAACFLIGMQDRFKEQSESLAQCLNPQPLVLHMDAGHAVPSMLSSCSGMWSNFAHWYNGGCPERPIRVPDGLPPPTCLAADKGSVLHTLPWQRPSTEGSAEVDIPVQWTAEGKWFDGETTIQMMLKQQCQNSPAIRDLFGSKPATYGDLAKFCKGAGDLSQYGVGPGDRVAYLVDEGPISAVLFLTLASQCTAAPLQASISSEELLSTLHQLKVRLTITMKDYEDKVSSSIKKIDADMSCCELGYALVQQNPSFAGSFTFEKPPCAAQRTPPTMRSHCGVDEIALVLRTSGTTSKPKVVPLRLGALTGNGGAIAKSLQLTSEDVCINAMPLFHIGGLSASILATLATGGSVICMSGFRPEEFLENVLHGASRPTWYSAVPTIHMAVLPHLQRLREAGDPVAHKLRFIRSGAAALSADAAVSLREAWGCRILPTYSMSEQMPISQPPCDYDLSHRGSVGIPMPSVVVVDAELRPLALEAGDAPNIGEICISGPTMMQGYEDNPHANAQSFFLLGNKRYFRTGDLGHLDKDGYLHLAGRQKELIKVGGEQVSPFELEEFISRHYAVKIALAFGIPDEIRGEVVCAALVLHDSAVEQQVVAEIRQSCMQALAAYKVPKLYVVEENQLVLNSTKKYVRKALGLALGLVDAEGKLVATSRHDGVASKEACLVTEAFQESESGILSDATLGIRFFLSLIVCLNHIGDHAWQYENEKDHSLFSATVTSARTVGDIGVVCFGMLAGFSMSASMAHPVAKGRYLKFYESRLVPVHLMYLIAGLLCVVNRLFMCPPDSFKSYTWESDDACSATILNMSWSGTWIVSLLVFVLTLQAWPIGVYVWHISYYTWFSSAYQFCIFCFPWIHKKLLGRASRGPWVLARTFLALHGLHYLTLVLMEAVYLSYRHENPEFVNYWIYAGYMFPPFWACRFACGCLLGVTFLERRPDQSKSAWKWGLVTDIMTLGLLAMYTLLIVFRVQVEHRFSWKSLLEDRMYCGVTPRVMVPILSLYLYGLAVGKGITARVCCNKFLVQKLAPASYSIYLLHQPVFEWYSLATRGFLWSRRKRFAWFSPDPMEVDWLEALLIIMLTVVFSIAVTEITNRYLMGRWLAFVRFVTCRRRSKGEEGSRELVLAALEDLTGLQPAPSDRLQDTGLASLGISVLISTLAAMDARLKALSPSQLMSCDTVQDLVDTVQTCRVSGEATTQELV
eukprot:TRINITY_DN33685_c0_g1_i1.p1 TRINITY_DN33685_c0_g1~~TRINITY_DN33685_c0_g1_i1.p1  ORF type:complete len:1438 (+),score=217.99 TRINITY_DN33685_c0_g1_i1:39-4352(+)